MIKLLAKNMLLRFSCSALLTLTGIAGSEAFVSPVARQVGVDALHVGSWENEDFLNALSNPGGDAEDSKDEKKEEDNSGGSRFKEIMQQAQTGGAERQPRAIDNPFLNPPPTTPVQSPANVENMSVEDQARMFREMMQNQQNTAPAPAAPQQRVARTDKAGRPVGRNKDADTISNTADLYFAQLKRDSSVRTMARVRGEDDIADQVMTDEGIKQLEEMIVENPYLKAEQGVDQNFYESVPEEALKPFLEPDNVDEQKLSSSGISYKEVLKQRRQKKGATVDPANSQSAQVVQVPEPTPETESSVALVQPQPVELTEPQKPLPQLETIPPQPPQPAMTAPVVEATLVKTSPQPAISTAASPEEARSKIRTLMGLTLKHRGGPGFGSGRLKGPEIDRFDNLLSEVTALLKAEALKTAPIDTEIVQTTQTPSAPAPVQPREPVPPAPAVHATTPTASLAQVEGAVACIDGAVSMFKNSPPELREGMLVTMRAALVSAVNTCNAAIPDSGDPSFADPFVKSVSQLSASSDKASMDQVDGAVACMEGAVSMFKNSPDELRSGMLVTLRAALMSAINTCNAVIANNEAKNVADYQAATGSEPKIPSPSQPSQFYEIVTPSDPVAVEAAATPDPPVAPEEATDVNSKRLEQIYEQVKAAAGEGSLGLRSDLTSSEASALADQLVEMRDVLMDELDAGIPDPEPAEPSGAPPATNPSEGSSASKYQQMLAKARAEKA